MGICGVLCWFIDDYFFDLLLYSWEGERDKVREWEDVSIFLVFRIKVLIFYKSII